MLLNSYSIQIVWELAKPIGLRPLNPLYGMVNFFELHLTAQVEKFWNDLMALGSEVLDKAQLIGDAKAAIASGDLKWINENVGELNQKQLSFIYKRLEREAY